MKKLGESAAIYVVWLILLVVTYMLEGTGSGMAMNYLFLAAMGILIFVMDRRGLARIGALAGDLKNIADRLLGNKSYQEFMGEKGDEAGLSADEIELQNAQRLETMEMMDFRQPAANEDWHRLLKDWKSSDGMGCEVEDYLFEDEMLEYSNSNVCSQVPGILTALGILGTFIGLVMGLRSFDFSNADQMTSSVEALVGGLNVAFYTSIYGVSLSIIFNFIFRRRMTAFSQELNRFYDVFHAALRPASERELADKFSGYQEAQNGLLAEMRDLLNERFGERLAGQMAKTLTPVFDKINLTLNNIILNFNKEQMAALEKIVDAFVDQMGGALKGQVETLGESVGQLSEAQKEMSRELKELIGQIEQTGTDTAEINAHSQEILSGFNDYIEVLQKSTESSSKTIEQMGKWTDEMKAMTSEQSSLLGVLTEHESRMENLYSGLNSSMNNSQQLLRDSLDKFSQSAGELAKMKWDPMQVDDFKEALSAYLADMQKAQAEDKEKLTEAMAQLMGKAGLGEQFEGAIHLLTAQLAQLREEQAEGDQAVLQHLKDNADRMAQEYARLQQLMEKMNAEYERLHGLMRQSTDEQTKQYKAMAKQMGQMTRELQNTAYLNDRTFSMISSFDGGEKISRLPEMHFSMDGRGRESQMEEKLDEWMGRQEHFQRMMLEQMRLQNRSLFARARDFFKGLDHASGR